MTGDPQLQIELQDKRTAMRGGEDETMNIPR